MALIVFFRGINLEGHRAFRPSVLVKELGIYDAVNVGAEGTLVIRKPGLRAKRLAELHRKLPFEATIAFCDGGDLIRLSINISLVCGRKARLSERLRWQRRP